MSALPARHAAAPRKSGRASAPRTTGRAATTRPAELAAIVASSEDAIVSCGLDNIVLTWNAAAERLFGHSAAQAVGRPIMLIYPASEQARAKVNLDLARNAAGPRRYEAVRRARDGTLLDVAVTTFPIRDSAGRIKAVGVTYRDVSQHKKAEQALAQLAAIVESSGDAIVSRGLDGIIRSWNPAAERLFGWSAAEAVGRSIGIIVPPDRRGQLGPLVERVLAVESLGAVESTHLRKDGTRIETSVTFSAMRNALGEVASISLIYRDITKRKREEETQARLSAIVEQSDDAIISRDLDRKILTWNSAAERLFGWTAAEAIGRSMSLIVPPERLVENMPYRDRVHAGVAVPAYDTERLTKDGRRIAVSLSQSAIKNARGEVISVSVIFRDVTERRHAQEHIAHLSQYDTLTGLPNRSLFRDRLELALARARRREERLGIMLFNLDRFRQVNEALGLHAGDDLLRQVAVRLKDNLRGVDTIARLGGDEFAILVEGATTSADVLAVAEKVLDAFATPFRVDESEIVAAGSIGITMYPNGTDDSAMLLEHAEIALERVKLEGGSYYRLYKEDPASRRGQRFELETRLRHALERGEISVHYQPKVSLATGAIVGVEALVRWDNPELGSVSPAQLIPVAEETGLIVPIGEWVLQAACAQAKAWEEQGLPVQIAVNLSPRQFRQRDLAKRVSAVLADVGLAPARLELEITETAAMANPEQAIAVLCELQQLGVRLAVDDFGTGYSSLSYLKRFPLNRLKIDRVFVKDLGTNPHDAAIIQATIALAGSLNLNVTAEGVETDSQREFLARAGCDEYQGFLFSRPLTADGLTAMLQDRATASGSPARATA